MHFFSSFKATVATAFAAVAVVVTACGPNEPDKPVANPRQGYFLRH